MRRILVVGSGGREHVLAWRLTQDAVSCNLHAAPGNPGIARIGTCHAVADISSLVELADVLNIDLTIVGPEAPLAAGIVDTFQARGLRIVGPTQRAAEIESSKAYAKMLMRRCGIPTADFVVFDGAEEAIAYVRRGRRPLVVKADGLAAGKGVVVADDPDEAERAVVGMMVHRRLGEAGDRVVIEERLDGREASVLAFVTGRHIVPLLPAQDFKRAQDGDRGPNTGGMGAVAPAPLPDRVLDRIVDEILEPIASAMVREGRPYTGVLYAGIMVTSDGPRVLEFNCRFGDPEAQVILPLLRGDFAGAMIDMLEGRPPRLDWRNAAAVCVVLASGGYPARSDTGRPIAGVDKLPGDVLLFHAGTAVRDGRLVTAGGRVLNVVGLGATQTEARDRAYAGVGHIHFDGAQFRRDIGAPAPLVTEEVSV